MLNPPVVTASDLLAGPASSAPLRHSTRWNYAQQSDYADNPSSFDTDYLVEGGASVSGVTFKVGHENAWVR